MPEETDPGPITGTSGPTPVSKPLSEAEFLEKHAELVYNLSLRLTGNPFDAEDLAQDALLRALKALPGFRGDSATATWMYRITVNTWKNRVRSEKRRGLWKMVPLQFLFGEGAGEEKVREPRAPEPAPDRALEREETAMAVQNALLTLDEESRAVIVLRETEGMSYQDIAAALSIPEGTVKSRLSRARDELKRRLQGLEKAS